MVFVVAAAADAVAATNAIDSSELTKALVFNRFARFSMARFFSFYFSFQVLF